MQDQYSAKPEFVPGVAGDLFVMQFEPDGSRRGTVLLVPPFAEEMNRCRRMVSLQARMFAQAGFRAVIPDLYGTGDSSGQFGDARWDIWVRDIRTLIDRAESRDGNDLVVWSIRLGALLMFDAMADTTSAIKRSVLWAPSLNGQLFVSQFLRLRTMGQALAAGADRESVSELRGRISDGETLEVGGYALHPSLIQSIENAAVPQRTSNVAPGISWFEIAERPERAISPNVKRTCETLIACGYEVALAAVEGPQFWCTVETATSKALLEATAGAL